MKLPNDCDLLFSLILSWCCLDSLVISVFIRRRRFLPGEIHAMKRVAHFTGEGLAVFFWETAEKRNPVNLACPVKYEIHLTGVNPV